LALLSVAAFLSGLLGFFTSAFWFLAIMITSAKSYLHSHILTEKLILKTGVKRYNL
jgi:hypothetical protein